MVRNPSVDKNGMKKGAWSEEEDNILRAYIERHGHSNWRQLPKFAGIARCGKSCRLRWLNYLKPGLKKGIYTKEEEELIIKLRQQLGNKWSIIASKLPGRTDNEIKNYWHTHLKKGTKQAVQKPCVSRQKTSEKNHLPDQNKNPSIIITESKNDQECINDIDDNSFLELYDIFENEPFSLDELNTMISPSAGSCNSTMSFTEPSGSFLDEPFSFDATNTLISPSSGSFLNEPFSLDVVTNSLVSPSSSCNSTIPISATAATATGESWEEPLLIEASNNQVFHTNCEKSINAGSGWTEPSWLSTFYQVLSSSSSSSSKNEGFNLPFSASDGYDMFNYSKT